jgi:hypothetical protein
VNAIDPIRTQRCSQGDSRRGDLISPWDLRKILPFEPAATSARRGWVGLEAVLFRTTPAFEFDDAVPTHHSLALELSWRQFNENIVEMIIRRGADRQVPPGYFYSYGEAPQLRKCRPNSPHHAAPFHPQPPAGRAPGRRLFLMFRTHNAVDPRRHGMGRSNRPGLGIP